MADDLAEALIRSFRWHDPGPETTHLVSDLSGWWREPRILGGLGPGLAALFPDARPTHVVAPEVTGLIVGPLVAAACGAGFVPAYKRPGDHRRRPGPVAWRRTGPDFRGRTLTLGVSATALGAGDRVLLVDDWADTGAQLHALAALIRDELGAEVVGAAVIVDGRGGPGQPPAGGVAVRGLLSDADLPG